MKKFRCFLIFGLLAYNLSAQIKVASNNNVGISEDNPLVKLHITASGAENALIRTGSTGTGIAGIYFDASNGDFKGADYGSILQGDNLSVQINNYGYNPIIFKTNQTERIRVTGSGYVGIGIDDPDYKLDVDGDVASNGVVLTSDERLKENIKDLTLNMDKLKQINGVSYELKKIGAESIVDNAANLDVSSKTDSLDIGGLVRRTRYGVLAQEVKKVFPELVDQREDGYYNVDYFGLIPVLIEAVKEQQEIIEEMQEKIEELSNSIGNTTAFYDQKAIE